MRINSVQFYTNKNISNNRQKPNKSNMTFTSWTREVYGPVEVLTKSLKHRNDTWFYRGNPDWTTLVKYLGEKYKDTPKVNVYNWGCSNGSETYTLLMELFTLFAKSFSDKFLPIYGFDYDSVAIEYANLGEIVINDTEEKLINENTCGKMEKFFRLTKPNRASEQNWYEPLPILRDNVRFREADILKDYSNMKKDNTVVLAKNFWPYVNYKNKVDFAKKLYKHLGENSTLIIGGYDNVAWDAPMATILRDAGFKETKIENVFEK